MERNINNHPNRERGGFNGSGDNNLLRTSTNPPETRSPPATTPPDFVLRWGNRKRLRCMKVQGKDRHASSSGAVRVDRRVVRSDLNGSKEDTLNLRQRPASPNHRVLRNSEGSVAMKGGHNNGGGAQDKRGSSAHVNTTTANSHHHHTNNSNSNHHHHHHHTNTNTNNNISNGGVGSGSGSDTVHDSKKGGLGTSSGSDAMPVVWPPKFVIGLTNKEKEEDFYAFKGTKLPQRPKKRAKLIQRTLNADNSDERIINQQGESKSCLCLLHRLLMNAKVLFGHAKLKSSLLFFFMFRW